jgi:magnesium-transporting ATPase (P-type)
MRGAYHLGLEVELREALRTPFRIVTEVLREPMLALLFGGGVIYLALGDLKEALILIVFATLSVLITVIQETRTERVLEALRDLTCVYRKPYPAMILDLVDKIPCSCARIPT